MQVLPTWSHPCLRAGCAVEELALPQERPCADHRWSAIAGSGGHAAKRGVAIGRGDSLLTDAAFYNHLLREMLLPSIRVDRPYCDKKQAPMLRPVVTDTYAVSSLRFEHYFSLLSLRWVGTHH